MQSCLPNILNNSVEYLTPEQVYLFRWWVYVALLILSIKPFVYANCCLNLTV